MEAITVRCPNCQKKQQEPCPKRCGCGRSLLAVLADLRGTARVVHAVSVKTGKRALDRPQQGPAAVSEPTIEPATAPSRPDGNDW